MKVSVIGQGYVGLTIAMGAAAVGHRVIGLDVNEKLISQLSQGNSYVPGVNKELLVRLIQSSQYLPTSDSNLINDSEVIIIAVPTPLTIDRKPDLTYIESAINVISKNMKTPALIVNESTSYPGTLQNFIKLKLEKLSKQKHLFAAAPERVDPGNEKWTLYNTPRVIAGLTDEATDKAIEFYSTFCEKVYRAPNAEVAEASKLFENTFRQINIALVNEFSEISKKLGFSANDAIKAASTKPFGFMPFFPSIGVGGHCIPVDPSYLSFISESFGAKAKFIELANQTNLLMPKKVALMLQTELGGSLKDTRIQLAGIAYKPDVSDMRESPAIELMIELEKLGAKVSWFDPLVGEFNNKVSAQIDPTIDLGLIVTPHKEIDFSVWKNSGTKVLDLSANSKDFGWPKFL
jgi:UDP-N-acetyl-D-glucosamine dehydrogenase